MQNGLMRRRFSAGIGMAIEQEKDGAEHAYGKVPPEEIRMSKHIFHHATQSFGGWSIDY